MPDRDTVVRQLFSARDQLMSIAFAMTRDWSAADDVVQEAFVFAVERYADVQDTAGILPWAKQVVRLKAMEALRAKRQAPCTLADELAPLMGDALVATETSGNEQHRDMRSALLACMGSLGAEQQKLLHGFYWERLSTDALAAQCGRSGTGVRTILNRLRSKLNDCVRQRLAQSEGTTV